MVWFTGHVEKNNLYALPVADAALGRCAKKAKRFYRETGASCSSTTSADVARSWLNLKKLSGLNLQVESGSILEMNAEDNTWKVTTEGEKAAGERRGASGRWMLAEGAPDDRLVWNREKIKFRMVVSFPSLSTLWLIDECL
jgi:hypothetical protein